MRVYQFRHIRAADSVTGRNTALRRLTYHDCRAPGSPAQPTQPRRAHDRICARGGARRRRRAGRDRRRPLTEAARDDALGGRQAAPVAHDGLLPGRSRRSDRADDPQSAGPLALPARSERDGRRRATLPSSRGSPRCRAWTRSIRASATAPSSTAARSRSARRRSGAQGLTNTVRGSSNTLSCTWTPRIA